MANPNATTIAILKTTRDALEKHRHPGQSYDGYLQELMSESVCLTDLATMKRLERYRTHARETIGDLITNALDQLDELEKSLTKKVG